VERREPNEEPKPRVISKGGAPAPSYKEKNDILYTAHRLTESPTTRLLNRMTGWAPNGTSGRTRRCIHLAFESDSFDRILCNDRACYAASPPTALTLRAGPSSAGPSSAADCCNSTRKGTVARGINTQR
jgi:hypothetical protein